MTESWKIAWPMMCLSIVLEIMYSSLEWGYRSRRISTGSSVANAREPKVSMIRLTQSIWMGLSTYDSMKAAPIRVHATATTLTVS